MALDPTERHQARTSPAQIARNPLFSHREKIELLNRLKAEVTGEATNPDGLAFDPAEIDAAIEEVRLEAQDSPAPVMSSYIGATR